MNKNILLIDDDEIHNFIAKTKLGLFFPDSTIEVVENATDGLTYLKNQIPALILLDVNMRELSGFQFVEKYSALGYDSRPTKIVMLSSSFFDKDVDRAKENDLIVDYIVKPCDFKGLIKYF